MKDSIFKKFWKGEKKSSLTKSDVEKIEKEVFKSQISKGENNPFAICTASVGRDDKDKYESCVMHLKEKFGISKSHSQDKLDDFIADEKKGEKEYRDVADATSDSEVAEVFNEMADDEAGHKEKLEEIAEKSGYVVCKLCGDKVPDILGNMKEHLNAWHPGYGQPVEEYFNKSADDPVFGEYRGVIVRLDTTKMQKYFNLGGKRYAVKDMSDAMDKIDALFNKSVDTSYAGGVPNSGLAEQDLEGDSSSTEKSVEMDVEREAHRLADTGEKAKDILLMLIGKFPDVDEDFLREHAMRAGKTNKSVVEKEWVYSNVVTGSSHLNRKDAERELEQLKRKYPKHTQAIIIDNEFLNSRIYQPAVYLQKHCIAKATGKQFKVEIKYQTDDWATKFVTLVVEASTSDEAKKKAEQEFYKRYPSAGGYFLEGFGRIEELQKSISQYGQHYNAGTLMKDPDSSDEDIPDASEYKIEPTYTMNNDYSTKKSAFKKLWLQKNLTASQKSRLADAIIDRLTAGDYQWEVKAKDFLRSKGASPDEIEEILEVVRDTTASEL